MVQELGETVQEMVKDDAAEVERILNARPKGHYWIVMHHKPTKQRLSTGEVIIKKVIKPYDVKPQNMLGTIVLEVKNGEIINETINLHDAPIDWGSIIPVAGWSENPYVQHRPDIGKAYVYNN